MVSHTQPEFVSDVDRWKHDLTVAGWVAQSATAWRSPDGSLWRGPFGAWKELQRKLKRSCSCNNTDPLLCHECEESTGICYCKCHKARTLKIIKVGVFPPDEGSRTYMAYTRWYSPQWPRCCEHEVEAVNGTDAKRVAIKEHKGRCESNADKFRCENCEQEFTESPHATEDGCWLCHPCWKDLQ